MSWEDIAKQLYKELRKRRVVRKKTPRWNLSYSYIGYGSLIARLNERSAYGRNPNAYY